MRVVAVCAKWLFVAECDCMQPSVALCGYVRLNGCVWLCVAVCPGTGSTWITRRDQPPERPDGTVPWPGLTSA